MNFVRLLVHWLLFFYEDHVYYLSDFIVGEFDRLGCFALYALLRHYCIIAALLLRHCHATTAPLLRHCYVGCAIFYAAVAFFRIDIHVFSSTRLGAIETRFRRFFRRRCLLPRIRTSKAGCLRWFCAISTSFLRHFSLLIY